MIPFNIPVVTGNEELHIRNVITNRKFSGDGEYVKKCQEWFNNKLNCCHVLLTPSCTHALEIMAILIDLKPGDEVIMPSFTFSSTANAFVLRGAHIVFVDISPKTMNIDENKIEEAISDRTKAIMVVHYAGVSCEMDLIADIAKKHAIYLLEDAAQGMMSTYKDLPLGTLGDMGAYSFHETKNYNCGEGGLLIIKDKVLAERAEIIQEKGTDRSKFFRGQVDKYGWVDVGSSYLISELNAAFLFAQLENAEQINQNRLSSWDYYYKKLIPLEKKGHLVLPIIPKYCSHNGHIFFIKVECEAIRDGLIGYLKSKNIFAVFHYQPLHSSKMGTQIGHFHGVDVYTSLGSEQLIRLPLFYGLQESDQQIVVQEVHHYLSSKSYLSK